MATHQNPKFPADLCAVSTVRALTIAFVLIMVAMQAQAITFNVIYNFTGGADGTSPYAGLAIDQAGNLYGTTLSGGAGFGTVFQLTKTGSTWTETTLYTFRGGFDGASPRSKVVIGPDGNLYGETFAGGGLTCTRRGCGTVFMICLACGGTETVLYRFSGGTDGGEPVGDLVFDPSGSLYGTTVIGGKPYSCSGSGCGTVYKLTPAGGTWTETVLYQFQGTADGTFPNGGVVFDKSGNLYGTTCCGGARSDGTVFELIPSGSGWTKSLVYTFQGSTDGKEPVTGLIFDAAGDLYGSTIMGGTGRGGTIFELSPSASGWTFATIYSPTGVSGPYGTLTMDANGNLYGTTFQDGSHLFGSAFKLTPAQGTWTYTSFHDFADTRDGGYPLSNLIFDTSGNLYGTGAMGGTTGNGVVVQITP